MRKKHPSFLLEGKMIKPFLKCESRPVKMAYKCWNATGEADVPGVITSFWENGLGKRIGFATNWRTEPSEIVILRPDGRREKITLGTHETIELR